VSTRLIWAEVLAVGNHVRSVEVGDRVLFNPDDRHEVEISGEDYLLLRERDIHALAAQRIEPNRSLPLTVLADQGHIAGWAAKTGRRSAADGDLVAVHDDVAHRGTLAQQPPQVISRRVGAWVGPYTFVVGKLFAEYVATWSTP